ncbi:alpha/beta fold hydrolase [Pseudomonas sp. LRF_L74]|uniref:alpha/beta fold hydrolase n=1 Tax=Pseudomonas sp. LRF_L74 TaxID=3369422 RepID=UPI003F5F8577
MRLSPLSARHAEPGVQRPVLLLLPGMVCNHRAWSAQIEGLADLAEPCVIDYGLARSLDGMARHVLAQAPTHFYLAGHSMGARVAMEVARQAPQRVLGLCLIGTEHRASPPGEQGRQEQAGRMALLDTANRHGMQRMAEDWLPHLLPQERQGDTALTSEILAMIAEHSPEQLAAHIDAGANRPDASELLPTLHMPTLLLAGSEDRIRPPQAHRDMAQRLPDCRLEIIQRCGHMLTLERPEAVNEAMRAWLQRCLRAPAS